MGRILILDTGGRCPFSPEPGDRVVNSAAGVLRILNDEDFELLIVCPGGLTIPLDSLIKRALSKKPLMGAVVVGDEGPESRISRTLVDSIVPPDIDPGQLSERVGRVLEMRRILTECDLTGKSPDILAVGELIIRIAPTDLPVLVIGESGTGKELVAKAIHRKSTRSARLLLTINAAAIPVGTLESELFGHEKGSFTGAARRHSGYFEQANGGTVFLDEVAELPIPVQAKLLRVLEAGDFLRVGGTGNVHTDIRLIAATNKDLADSVSRGDFREDLYYRLAAVKIKIPPLRDRPEDIPVLIYKFISEVEKRHGRNFGGISERAVIRMMDYHWPGNVRELRNLVENAVILAGDKPVIPEDLEAYFIDHDRIGRNLPAILPMYSTEDERLGAIFALIFSELRNIRSSIDNLLERLDSTAIDDPAAAEKANILRAFRDNDYDKRLAARQLGISLRTLYRRLKKYSIESKA